MRLKNFLLTPHEYFTKFEFFELRPRPHSYHHRALPLLPASIRNGAKPLNASMAFPFEQNKEEENLTLNFSFVCGVWWIRRKENFSLLGSQPSRTLPKENSLVNQTVQFHMDAKRSCSWQLCADNDARNHSQPRKRQQICSEAIDVDFGQLCQCWCCGMELLKLPFKSWLHVVIRQRPLTRHGTGIT